MAKSKKRTGILVLEVIGSVLLCGSLVAGVACATFGASLLALGIGGGIGVGIGLLIALEGET